MELGKGLLTLRSDFYWQSDAQNILNKSTSKQYYLMPSFSIFNISATYCLDDWDVSLWVKNLGNSEGVTGVYTEAYMGSDPSQNYYGNGSKFNNALPRTLGVTVSYSF